MIWYTIGILIDGIPANVVRDYTVDRIEFDIVYPQPAKLRRRRHETH